VLKKIVDSIDNGLEGAVFSKYVEYVLANQWISGAKVAVSGPLVDRWQQGEAIL
jgi:hypothetical protein